MGVNGGLGLKDITDIKTTCQKNYYKPHITGYTKSIIKKNAIKKIIFTMTIFEKFTSLQKAEIIRILDKELQKIVC